MLPRLATATILLALATAQAQAPLGCDNCTATGSDASALGWRTNASGISALATGEATIADGVRSATATGYFTHASNFATTAMGSQTKASGSVSTAMGDQTSATGTYATSMGRRTIASGQSSTAVGADVNATEDESLAVSGNVYAKNVHVLADARLTKNDATPMDVNALLASVMHLSVVSHSKSDNFCLHTGGCGTSGPRLIAQDVAKVLPKSVKTGTSLTLRNKTDAEEAILETLPAAQSLDLHALIAHLVGATQAQAQQIRALTAKVEALEKKE